MSESKVTYHVTPEVDPTTRECGGCQVLNDICRALCRFYDDKGADERFGGDDPDGERLRFESSFGRLPAIDEPGALLKDDLTKSRLKNHSVCPDCGQEMVKQEGGEWVCFGCGYGTKRKPCRDCGSEMAYVGSGKYWSCTTCGNTTK
jgi:ribosomal protein L37AE/L43A